MFSQSLWASKVCNQLASCEIHDGPQEEGIEQLIHTYILHMKHIVAYLLFFHDVNSALVGKLNFSSSP